MALLDSSELLQRFNRDRSETAFRGLVQAHSALVYDTALRRLGGDRAAAQDVMQEVFTLLARKSYSLQNVQLGAWLYRQTCRRASNHARAEQRRRVREKVAAQAAADHASGSNHSELRSEVDEAMMSLAGADRDALVLRYLEAKEFRSIGTALGISEEAARKRVTRAMEKLCGVLQRRGIAVASVSLGATMTGMGGQAVPTALISTVTSNALKTNTLASSVPLWPLLKAAIAACLLTSLAAGVKLIADYRSHQTTAALLVPAATAPATTRPGLLGALPPAGSSLEAIIEELKRVRSGPANTMTRLRTAALLERVDASQVPEFVALGEKRLTPAEREASYPSLFQRWMDSDPQAAMDFVLQQRLSMQVGPGDNLINLTFKAWVSKDPRSAAMWLGEKWEDEELGKPSPYEDWRTFLAMHVVTEIYQRNGNTAAVLGYVGTIPSLEDQAKVLCGVSGDSPQHQAIPQSSADKLLEFHEALKQFPEEVARRQASAALWRSAAAWHPEEIDALLARLEPIDRFTAELGLLLGSRDTSRRAPLESLTQSPELLEKARNIRPLAPGETFVLPPDLMGAPRDMLDWEPIQSLSPPKKAGPAVDLKLREKEAMDAAIAAGMTQDEALSAIAPAILEILPDAKRFAWLDTHRNSLHIDPWLAEKARQAGNERGMSKVAPEWMAIGWASYIRDPELRLSLCRASFRRMFAQHPAAARGLAEKKLTGVNLPPGLAVEFRKIVSGEDP